MDMYMRTLVLYVCHEINYRVEYFIKNAIFKDDNTDFLIICNNPNIKIECPDYVTVIHRDNDGFDFGAWSVGLFDNDRRYKYDYYIFANSTIIGPFIHHHDKQKWTEKFTDGLVGNVKLFGSFINTCRAPERLSHVQSFIFSMSRETLAFLIDHNIFSITSFPVHKPIWEFEWKMSNVIIRNGWNIGCLMRHYKDVDFTFREKPPHAYNIRWLDDVGYPECVDKLYDKYETVFIKANRCNGIYNPN